MSLRLKSLELNGYKTFATKTRFEFSGNITVVVGPNGSGKSNIADSLRWVLGEQSYKLLRGQKTDDMIFSGSESRSRASMASASVTFDNSDGWLPIDFSEVSVTRRAYRDGQNDYLINNQKVRLRDVTELLSKSGLAERTYTIIGQGLVDTALALKSEERRRLFEEAAGIGLYRKRKEQAIRRLDTTKRNLERVQDILAELSPRLRSLERQAKRAQEYEQVRADLRAVLREWYGYHWRRAQNELLTARQAAEEQETGLSANRRLQENADSDLTALRDEINGMRARLSSWHRELSQVHLQRENMTRDLAVSGERQRSLFEQQASLQSDLIRLQEEEKLYQERVDAAQQNLEKLELQANEAEKHAAEARNKLDVEANTHRQLEEEVEQLRNAVTASKARQVEIKTRMSQLQNQVERYGESKADLESELAQSESDLQDAHTRLSAAQQNLDKAKKLSENAHLAWETQEQEIVAIRDRLQEVNKDAAKLQSSVARLEAQLDVLDQAEKSLTGYADGAKTLVAAAQQGELTGVKGILSGQLNVPEEYETAIVAALGEFLDAVVISNSDIDNAVSIVVEAQGKAALLPLDNLRPRLPESLPSHPDVIGVASQLIQVEPALRPAVDVLLGQVLVVRDRETARSVLRGRDRHFRSVTLAGELFYANGAALVQAGGASVLSRPREKQELIVQLNQSRQAFDQLQAEGDQLAWNQEKVTDELKQAGLDRDSARTQLDQATDAHRSVSLEFEQAKNLVKWRQTQIDDSAREVEDAERLLISLRSEAVEVADQVTVSEEAVRQSELALKGHTLTDARKNLAHWETETAVVKQAVMDAKHTYDERKHALERVLGQAHTLTQQRDKIDEEVAGLKQAISSTQGAEGDIKEKITALQALIEPTEQDLQQAEAKLEAFQNKETESRRELNMAERRNAQAQIALARAQESLDGLRQRIEDDFGLVEFSYDESVSGPTPLPLGEMVERLPVVTELAPEMEETLKRYRVQLRRMGAVNPEAQHEYKEVKERHHFMIQQMADLEAAEHDIREVIAELDVLMDREFRKTFEQVAAEFREIFGRLFKGGSARLLLTDEEDMSESGVDIEARLPGKRMQRLALLSGGERSMTAVALVFALLKASPTPFCVMDEVDAALDEANVERLRELLLELGEQTQFVVITHNRNTVQVADLIYGITMGRDSSSQSISLKLEDVDERYSN